jgi:hypothetical protein
MTLCRLDVTLQGLKQNQALSTQSNAGKKPASFVSGAFHRLPTAYLNAYLQTPATGFGEVLTMEDFMEELVLIHIVLLPCTELPWATHCTARISKRKL